MSTCSSVGERPAGAGHLSPVAAAMAVAAFMSSCAGAPASPQAPASSSAIASVPLPRPPDLSPVPMPSGLVVSGALPNLGASLKTVHGWTQLPMPQSEQVTETIAGEALGAIVDLEQPIDFAVAVSGSGSRLTTSVAISAAVRDVEGSKAALSLRYKLVPGDNGALVIQRALSASHATDDDKSADDSEDDAHVCELAPSNGASAMRLVCGWDARALTVLGPWLTRGATRERPTADGEVQLRMDPLKATLVEDRRMFSLLLGTVLGSRVGDVGTRTELAQAVGGDLLDFGSDLDTGALAISLGDPGALATLTLKLTGGASALARIATANADRNGPAPAAFWQMPADADFALFERGIDPNALARGRDLVLKIVGDELAEDGVNDADRHAVTDALGKLATSAPLVYASGLDVDAVRKALTARTSLPGGTDASARREADRVAAQSLLGWRIVEIDESVSVREGLKGLAAACARPGVVTAYRTKGLGGLLGIRSASLPKASPLPKDTQHYVSNAPLIGGSAVPVRDVHAKGGAIPKPLVLDVFVVPDGARTWVGVGGDAALLMAKLTAAVAGSGDLLGSRPELAALKTATAGTGGYFSIRAVSEAAQQMDVLDGGELFGSSAGGLLESTTQPPHQGTTPILFTATAATGTPASLIATLQLPRAAVDDIVAVALKHGW